MEKSVKNLVKTPHGRNYLNFYWADAPREVYSARDNYPQYYSGCEYPITAPIRFPNVLLKHEGYSFAQIFDKVFEGYENLRSNKNWDVALSDFSIVGDEVKAYNRNAVEVKIRGDKFINMITLEAYKLGLLTEADRNLMKARFALETEFEVKQITGEDIKKIYAEHCGVAGCMAGKPEEYFQIYADNPDVFVLHCVFRRGKLLARMLETIGKYGSSFGSIYSSGDSAQTAIAENILDDYMKEVGDTKENEAYLCAPVRDYPTLPYVDALRYTDGDYMIGTEGLPYDINANYGGPLEVEPVIEECPLCGVWLGNNYELVEVTTGNRHGETGCTDCCTTVTFGCEEGEMACKDDLIYSEYNEGWCLA